MKQKRIYNFLIGVGIFLLILGAITKIMHWPFSAGFTSISYVIILLVYPRLILKKTKRTKIDAIKVGGIYLWGSFGILFLLYYPEHKLLFKAISRIGILIWLGFSLYEYNLKNYESANPSGLIIKLGYGIGFGGLALGYFFKIMHWPNANVLLVLSAIVAGLTFFYTNFVEGDE